ncbi:hypothetical protein Scep_012826 [Stephania cephalantha]|uniref:Uncharacterized protein n=1 Tax=Stephania cephalantha TaxID=152367 RepID=A0AAP0P722_9MAGN
MESSSIEASGEDCGVQLQRQVSVGGGTDAFLLHVGSSLRRLEFFGTPRSARRQVLVRGLSRIQPRQAHEFPISHHEHGDARSCRPPPRSLHLSSLHLSAAGTELTTICSVEEFARVVREEGDEIRHSGVVDVAPKVLADVVESILVALYIDSDYDLKKLWDDGPSHERRFICSVQIDTKEGHLQRLGDMKFKVKDAKNSSLQTCYVVYDLPHNKYRRFLD